MAYQKRIHIEGLYVLIISAGHIENIRGKHKALYKDPNSEAPVQDPWYRPPSVPPSTRKQHIPEEEKRRTGKHGRAADEKKDPSMRNE